MKFITTHYNNGQVKEKLYVDDENRYTGLYQRYRVNGSLLEESHWKKGLKHGIQKCFFSNDNLYIRYYDNGFNYKSEDFNHKTETNWVCTYDKDKYNTLFVKTNKNGERYEEREWSENNQLFREVKKFIYSNCIYHAKWKNDTFLFKYEFDTKGNKKDITPEIKTGKHSSTGKYYNYESYYDDNGKLIKQQRFKNGILYSTSTFTRSNKNEPYYFKEDEVYCNDKVFNKVIWEKFIEDDNFGEVTKYYHVNGHGRYKDKGDNESYNRRVYINGSDYDDEIDVKYHKQ